MTRYPRYKYRYRSAITGKFVSREYAEANPETTVSEAKFVPDGRAH